MKRTKPEFVYQLSHLPSKETMGGYRLHLRRSSKSRCHEQELKYEKSILPSTAYRSTFRYSIPGHLPLERKHLPRARDSVPTRASSYQNSCCVYAESEDNFSLLPRTERDNAGQNGRDNRTPAPRL